MQTYTFATVTAAYVFAACERTMGRYAMVLLTDTRYEVVIPN